MADGALQRAAAWPAGRLIIPFCPLGRRIMQHARRALCQTGDDHNARAADLLRRRRRTEPAAAGCPAGRTDGCLEASRYAGAADSPHARQRQRRQPHPGTDGGLQAGAPLSSRPLCRTQDDSCFGAGRQAGRQAGAACGIRCRSWRGSLFLSVELKLGRRQLFATCGALAVV